MSTSPGTTRSPLASKTSPSVASAVDAVSTLPSRITRSRSSSMPCEASTRRPPLMTVISPRTYLLVLGYERSGVLPPPSSVAGVAATAVLRVQCCVVDATLVARKRVDKDHGARLLVRGDALAAE